MVYSEVDDSSLFVAVGTDGKTGKVYIVPAYF